MRGLPDGIFALDLGSTVGWAYGHPGGEPTFGVWVLPRLGGEGARYASFENELGDALEDLAPRYLILEGHLPLPALNNVAAARQQFGLRAGAYSEAYRASCAVSEVDVHTVRREVMGVSRLSSDVAKREVLQHCRRIRGWKVTNHNAADALLLWKWMADRMRGDPPVAGPLYLPAPAK